MYLSKRLQEVANLVPKSATVADIGCDHAHVAIYLIENHLADKVIACDVNKGPLCMARANVEQAGLADKIELRLSDGLGAVKLQEADSIIIAGMGGKLMLKIICEGMDKLQEDTALILQPQSDLAEFRKYLIDNNFCIEQESMIFEDGKFYPMMRVGCCNNGSILPYDEMECLYGRMLLESKNEVLHEYLIREREQLKTILESLSVQGTTDRSVSRKSEIEKKILINEQALRRFE